MKLRITVEGRIYEVEVEVSDPEPRGPSYYPPLHADLPANVQPARPSTGPAGGGAAATPGPEAGDESKVCRSPLAGAVARIDVEVGQEIGEDDVLLVLEAMKMETVITAPFAGIVKSVNAEVGDAVTQGQVLVEIE